MPALGKEKSGELEKNPVRIVGSYVNANSPKKNQGYISNYGSLVRGLLADNPEVITVMSSSSYISITEFESDNLAFMFYILFLIGLCVFFIVMGIIGRKKKYRCLRRNLCSLSRGQGQSQYPA